MKCCVVGSPRYTAWGPEGVQSLAATPEFAHSRSLPLHRSSRASVCEDQSSSSKGSPCRIPVPVPEYRRGALGSMRSLGGEMMPELNVATNLVDQIKSYLTPEVVTKASAYVSESPPATEKALGGIVPMLLAGLANHASTSSGAQQLAQMLDAGKYDGSALGHLRSLFAGGVNTQSAMSGCKTILDQLFGGRLSSVTDFFSRYAGIRTGSASSLLALAVPLVLHVLGKQRAAIGPSPSALAQLLGEQRGMLGSLLPAGLGSLLGWSGLTSSGLDVESPSTRTVRGDVPPVRDAFPVRTSRGGPDWRWILPLLILGGLVLATLAWLWGGQAPTRTAVRDTTTEALKMADVQLPGGVRLAVPEGSLNYSLYQWLASSTDTTVPKRFVFTNLNFETGTTQLTPESVPTVQALVAIMKAYPNTVVRLEGYTDNTGDAAANKKLSLDRANGVKDLMVKGGIGEGRIGTAGYGPENPVADNSTDVGRAKNRRTELLVEKR